MNSPKFLQQTIRSILIIVLFAGYDGGCDCGGPFTPVMTVKVTPTGKFLRGSFVRIFWVPKRNRLIVTFNTDLSKSAAGVYGDPAYAYREYTVDMVPTSDGVILSGHPFTDTGALLVGNDFYLATQEAQGGFEGWGLAKYDALTWANPVGDFYPLKTWTFKTGPLKAGEDPGDPMLAYVNGEIDISSKYITDPTKINPWASASTHHQFFTTDLKFVNKQVLSDTPHINMTSMITVGDTINFIAGTALMGDLIVIQYDTSWKYLRTIPLKKNSVCPEGMAFDGKRFYVSYLDITDTTRFPTLNNVRLAAFDVSWNMLDDIAVTSFTIKDSMQTSRPSLALWDSRLYVCWDQAATSDTVISKANIQAYVKVYKLNP